MDPHIVLTHFCYSILEAPKQIICGFHETVPLLHLHAIALKQHSHRQMLLPLQRQQRCEALHQFYRSEPRSIHAPQAQFAPLYTLKAMLLYQPSGFHPSRQLSVGEMR
ncbi:hypothetical protein VNO80_14479 [Phaseolus coccineus]|uniref:Uncharacterized protein n=1 Tax=Phaseolus coccineus TaxID=3886 RepID=A0AAN9MII0_PHACN